LSPGSPYPVIAGALSGVRNCRLFRRGSQGDQSNSFVVTGSALFVDVEHVEECHGSSRCRPCGRLLPKPEMSFGRVGARSGVLLYLTGITPYPKTASFADARLMARNLPLLVHRTFPVYLRLFTSWLVYYQSSSEPASLSSTLHLHMRAQITVCVTGGSSFIGSHCIRGFSWKDTMSGLPFARLSASMQSAKS